VRCPQAPLAHLAPPGLARDTETNPNEAAYSPSGTQVVVSYDFLRHTDKSIYLYHATTPTGGLPSQVLRSHRDSPALAWIGEEVVVSGSNTSYAGLTTGDIFLWDRGAGGVLLALQGDGHGIVRGLAAHPALPLLLSCGVDNQLKLWSPAPSPPSP